MLFLLLRKNQVGINGFRRTAADVVHFLYPLRWIFRFQLFGHALKLGVFLDQAKKEVNSGFKPALKSKPENLGKYDIIFVGSPCWWYTIAPPVATFLSSYDLSGKTIAPFMTHEGSRMGHSEADIKKLCAGATLLPGLPVRGGSVQEAAPEVAKWLRRIGVIE